MWDIVSGDNLEIVSGDDFFAVAGAVDMFAQSMGYSGAEELMAVLGGGGDDAYAGASVEELLSAAAGQGPGRRMGPRPGAFRPGAAMMRPGFRPGMRPAFRPGATMTRPGIAQGRDMGLGERLAGAGLIMRQAQPTKARRFPLGFDSVTPVPAGAVVSIQSRPQVTFKPQRLIIPSTIGPSFLILALSVGKNPQTVAVSPNLGLVFSEQGWGVDLDCDTANIGQDVTMQVQNITGAPVRFFGSLIGPAAE